MTKTSFNTDLQFNNERVAIKLMLETDRSKEIRILMKTGQLMKEHQSAYPITVHILEGEIEFGVNGKTENLKTGDLVALASNVPHNLKAINDSIIRLTLSKNDSVFRVQKVIKNS